MGGLQAGNSREQKKRPLLLLFLPVIGWKCSLPLPIRRKGLLLMGRYGIIQKNYTFSAFLPREGGDEKTHIYIEGVIHEKTSENAAFLPVTGADHQIDVSV